MQFRCNGKIFVFGEYACLQGGPALLETLGPPFTLEVRAAAENAKSGDSNAARAGSLPHSFAAGSPAGLYLAKHADTLNGFNFIWTDPYEYPIGVGSSSAQFLLSVSAVSRLRGLDSPSAEEVLAEYWKIVGDSQGLRPSGADIIAQWLGGPIAVRNEPFEARRLKSWNTEQASFLLAYSGKKTRTHEHLKELQAKGFPGSFSGAIDQLNQITRAGIGAWERGDAAELGKALTHYQEALAHSGFSSAEYLERLSRLAELPGVLGCKGSGAQDGDCALLLIESSKAESVAAQVQAAGWQPIVPLFCQT